MTDSEVDLHRDVSSFLTEIRTVLKRAETALATIGDDPRFVVKPPERVPGEFVTETWQYSDGPREVRVKKFTDAITIPHPGAAEGIAALRDLVRRLEPYRKTGPTPKGRSYR